MSNIPKFRLPSEMAVEEKRVPVSSRLSQTTKAALEQESRKTGIPLAMLIANVLDDYVAWIKTQPPDKSGQESAKTKK